MKDIKGYEGLYAVTSCGKVWSYRRKKFLKPIPDKDGYLKVNLYKNDKLRTFQLHRLVADAYIDNPEGLPEVNHKDEVKDHDWWMNLEWCDREYNLNYGTRNERAGETRRHNGSPSVRTSVYCIELDMAFSSMTEASLKTGIDQGTISKACSGKRASAGRHPVTGEKLHWTTDFKVA